MDKQKELTVNAASCIDINPLLRLLKLDYPEVTFIAGPTFCWSPVGRQVIYKNKAKGVAAVYSLLHEVGHALLDHKRYTHDFELLEIEVAAWARAKVIAKAYSVEIDENHVQNCLDTYRDWLYRRSICPSCTTKTLQLDEQPAYVCFNCHAKWRVAPSRFCRPYRKVKGQLQVVTFAASR
jgi:hypothetical protein